jgi:hypothetical protein
MNKPCYVSELDSDRLEYIYTSANPTDFYKERVPVLSDENFRILVDAYNELVQLYYRGEVE